MIRHFINGKYVDGCGAVMDKHSPIDGTLAASVAEGGKAEVAAAVDAARAALDGPWGGFPAAKRAQLLQAVAAGIERRFDELVAAEVADTGKPVSLAREMDIPRSAANFRHAVEMISHTPNELFDSPTPDGSGALNYTVRTPVGVVAVVSPWNVPLLMLSSKVAPALACGNTVVVKPSEETPRTATLLGEIMNEAGVPAGVFNVVHGRGPDSAGEYLTRHPGVNAIAFTGETRTGAAIMKAAARTARSRPS
jgi:aminomuconate-semialdehyde/2-hydroxymuconate-6-semialdehyde dehydrogenase